MDAWTKQHLYIFAQSVCHEDELYPFCDWVYALPAEELEYYYSAGWPVALANFRCDEVTKGTECQWLVQKSFDGGGDPDWYPDFPEDCYRIVPCGDVVDPKANGPFCTFHREPMEMSDVEFEDQVENHDRSWS